ncbi:MAG: hypothetical protein PHI31_02480 [Desulfuromonadaceae bacterium]|nr:hypothetical protein [Desulfuromonadaceae bacterium]
MAGILIEQLGTVMILKITGELSFDGAVEALKGFYPFTMCNVLWDLRGCTQLDITLDQYRELLFIARDLMADRNSGKTAYVCSSDSLYEILVKLKMLKESNDMQYEYGIFREYDSALDWLSE